MGIAREIIEAFFEELRDPYFHRHLAEIWVTMLSGCLVVVAFFTGLAVLVVCCWVLFGCLLPALGVNL